MRQYIYLIFFLFITSCNYDKIYLLNNEELTWAEVYDDGDSVLFKSASSIDTMYVKKTINNHVGIIGVVPWDSYHGGIDFSNVIVHNEDSMDFSFMIMKDSEDDFIQILSNFHNRYYSGFLQTRNSNIRQQVPIKSFDSLGTIEDLLSCTHVVDNIKYNDLIIVDNNKSANNSVSDKNCEYFIWSKSKGLIQYKYEEGEVYSFYKILHKNKEHQ